MNQYVSEKTIHEAIEFFRKKEYGKPEQIGLYFFFKAMGVNAWGYTDYPKWGSMDEYQKRQVLRILYDLAGVFDAQNETGLKRTALFSFSIRKKYKAGAFYNGATPFQRLGSRVSDTLDNALVSTLLERGSGEDEGIKLRDNSVENLLDNYLKGNKISLELMAAWYHRFWEIDVPEDATDKDFSDVCVLHLIKQLKLTSKDYDRLFFYQNKLIERSENMISGDSLRTLLAIDKDVEPEISKEPSQDYMQMDAAINSKEASDLLSERGEVLTEDTIKAILEENDKRVASEMPVQPEKTNDSVSTEDEYARAANIIKQHLLESSLQFDSTDEEITDFLYQFREKFSPEALLKLNDSNIRQEMFYTSEQTNDSLCYWLEFNSFSRSQFGSIAGGSAYKFGLFQKKDDGTWITGTPMNPQELTEEESLEKAYSIRDKLIKSAEIIKDRELATVEDYQALEDDLKKEIGDFYTYGWVMKYYLLIFPEKFTGFYMEGWQRHVLYALGIMPSDSFLVRDGQIALVMKKTGLSFPHFGSALYDKFGGILQVVRIGTTDNDGKSHFEDWRGKSVAAIGWKELGELSEYETGSGLNKTALAEKMQELYYPDDKRMSSRKAGELITFYSTNKESVFVAMEGEKLLALGDKVGAYSYDEDSEFAHRKAVQWHRCFSNKEQLPNKSEGHLTSCKQLSDPENMLYLYHKYYYDLKDTVYYPEITPTPSYVHDSAGIEGWGAKKQHKPRVNTLHPLNQIIYGAPGTGKTYITSEYALAIIENRAVDTKQKSDEERKTLMNKYKQFVEAGRIIFTTFHQSYGYEEFIQGIRPDPKSSSINFIKTDGVFKRIADKAKENPDDNYVIIIDEINRGNISKIFGELITLIEDDKRYGELNELSVTLPMGETFTVPNNLYIIGTMNSADKSISLIDTALRRRFEFVEMPPNEMIVEDETLRSVLIALNAYLHKELRSTDLLIGHAYFIRKKADKLGDIMNRNIIPLLYEYFYDDEAKVRKALDCIKDTDFEIDTEYKGRIRIRKKA